MAVMTLFAVLLAFYWLVVASQYHADFLEAQQAVVIQSALLKRDERKIADLQADNEDLVERIDCIQNGNCGDTP